MFFTTTAPANFRQSNHSPAGRSLERFLKDTQLASRQQSCSIAQDEQAYTLSFDVPGITKDQLSIGIEGNVVRIDSVEGAQRQYKMAYRLAQDIAAEGSTAKLENGVLTVKLAKPAPVDRSTRIAVH